MAEIKLTRRVKYAGDIVDELIKAGWDFDTAVLFVNNLPDAKLERPKGRWRKYSSDEWICTHCGYDKYCDTLDGGVLPDFCEGCGADMRGESE